MSSAAALKSFGPFADLSDAERAEVADLLEERRLSRGETLFAEGDEAESAVLVVEGALQISNRRLRDTARLGAGVVVGGLALFSVGTRESAAEGAEPTQLLVLRREDFLRLAEDSPRTACRVAMALAAELAAHLRGALAALPSGSVDPAEAPE